jgi:hypothetical protein
VNFLLEDNEVLHIVIKEEGREGRKKAGKHSDVFITRHKCKLSLLKGGSGER